jgi:Rieske 2Fe-2S family protein
MTLRSNGAGSTRDHIASLLRQRTRGRALPAAFFRDDALFAAELDLIFSRHWLFVAVEPELPEAGDYVALSIGTAPIVLLRQDDGSISAFHNTCRHRGSLILQQPRGVIGQQADRLPLPSVGIRH